MCVYKRDLPLLRRTENRISHTHRSMLKHFIDFRIRSSVSHTKRDGIVSHGVYCICTSKAYIIVREVQFIL